MTIMGTQRKQDRISDGTGTPIQKALVCTRRDYSRQMEAGNGRKAYPRDTRIMDVGLIAGD